MWYRKSWLILLLSLQADRQFRHRSRIQPTNKQKRTRSIVARTETFLLDSLASVQSSPRLWILSSALRLYNWTLHAYLECSKFSLEYFFVLESDNNLRNEFSKCTVISSSVTKWNDIDIFTPILPSLSYPSYCKSSDNIKLVCLITSQ